jgi:hypothetical protein
MPLWACAANKNGPCGPLYKKTESKALFKIFFFQLSAFYAVFVKEDDAFA